MRKLAVASVFFALAIFASHYLLPYVTLPILCIIAAALSFIGLLFKGNARLRVFIAFLALSVGFLWSWAFTAIFVSPVSDFHNETIPVTAVVRTYPSPITRGHRVDVRIQRDGAPSIGARLYYSQNIELQPGDIIEFTGRFRRTDGYEDNDRVDSLTSRGNFLTASLVGNIVLVDTESAIFYFPQRIANAVAEMVNRLFSDEVALFMQALLTGRRDDLYADLSLSTSLSASGIVHVVSISGMHVAFLMGFLGAFLKNKRLFPVIGLPVLLVFMAMTGFTPSVTRAGLMQALLIFAPLLRRERDSLTSLAAALLLLLILNPYSVASVGMHLSFSATLGIILFSGKLDSAFKDAFSYTRLNEIKIIRFIMRFISASFSTTAGALVFTIPLTAIHFGYVSIIAPLTNLLTLWAVSFAFSFGLIVCILGFIFFPLASLVTLPLYLAVRYILAVARTLAAIPYSAVYASQAPIMFWLLYVYILFTLLPLMKAKARQYMLPVCTVVLTFCIVIFVPTIIMVTEDATVTILDVGQGQSVVITSGDYTAVIDCGGGRGFNAGAIAHEYLLSRGRTTIELLVVTHFHADHINGIHYLLTRTSVSALAIPDPTDSFVAAEIIDLAERRGTEIIHVTDTLQVPFGDTDLILYPPLGDRGDNERGVAVLAYGGISALITGDMASPTERALLRYAHIPQVDLLVVGHHGSRFSTSEELLSSTTPTLGVISVGRNSYGHPSNDALLRLDEYYVTVMRTDQKGNITVVRR